MFLFCFGSSEGLSHKHTQLAQANVCCFRLDSRQGFLVVLNVALAFVASRSGTCWMQRQSERERERERERGREKEQKPKETSAQLVLCTVLGRHL